MLKISHRGNISGRNPGNENNPDYIINALNCNYEVEIDVWSINGRFFLGHDFPAFEVKNQFLLRRGLWCHAKNYEALLKMLSSNIHCFWHEDDRMTLTSQSYIWTHESEDFTGPRVIRCNMGDTFNFDQKKVHGVCTDYPSLL